MAKRGKKPSSSNRRGMVAIALIVMVLLVGLLVQSQKLSMQNRQYEARRDELQEQINDEELRAGEIENLNDYVTSTEYIEKVAREKLGLVYEDEILFQAENQADN